MLKNSQAAFITVQTPVISTDMNVFEYFPSSVLHTYLATKLDTMRVGTTPEPSLVHTRVGANDMCDPLIG